MKTYLFSYPYQGSRYSLEIKADSREEAIGRFKAIPWGASRTYDGELKGTLPANMGWLARAMCRIRNAVTRGHPHDQ